MSDKWETEATRIIDEAAKLIAPGEGEAVFYIRVGGPYTSCTVKAAPGVDPKTMLDAAVKVLQAETDDLGKCPYHQNRSTKIKADQ